MADEGDDLIPGDFSGTVTIGTDYVFRGISQTDEGPTVQGSFDYAHDSGAYVGVWASNIDFDSFIEVDYYVGFGGEVNGISYDIGFNYFNYPGASFQDFWEAYVNLSYDAGPLAVTVGTQYSPDYFAETGDGWYPNAAIEIPINDYISVDATVGYQTIENNLAWGTPDYADWSIGLNASVEGFDLSVRYHDTDLTDAECFGDTSICEGRVVFTASRSF